MARKQETNILEGEGNNENNFENEAKIREFINLASLKKKEEKVLAINDLVEERIEKADPSLPLPLKAMVMDDYLKVRALTDDENILKAAIDVSFNRIICGYERRVTDEENMPNEAYARLNAMEKIDALFNGEKDPSSEDFKKIAHVTFDLNGLKAVNDYNGHDAKKGDMYLAMAVKAISSPEAIKYAEENGIIFQPEKITRDGGDEFSIIITSEKAITEDVLAGFIDTIQDSLKNNENVSKILDFNSPNVLAHHLDMKVAEVVSEINKTSLEDFKKAHGIPPNYKYEGAMSGGAVTLYEALTDERFDKKNKVSAGDQYPYMLQKMMGAMFSLSSKQMDEDKEEYKEGLETVNAEELKKELTERGVKNKDYSSGDLEEEVSHRHFLSEVYSRTDKEKKLTRENFELRKENKELEERLKLKDVQLSIAKEIISSGKTKEGLELLEKIMKI